MFKPPLFFFPNDVVIFSFLVNYFICFSYDGFSVPDTMNMHGVYDTAAFMKTFESRKEYQQHLQIEAGMSGSIMGFSGGIKQAWGGSIQQSSQQYIAILDVDVDRWVKEDALLPIFHLTIAVLTL